MKLDLLREADVDAALCLSRDEGWNQSRADWLRLLRLQPEGCFAARRDARLVATVTTVVYRRELAWIGMMIVDRAARGQGIGRALMRLALDHLRVLGIPTVKLDATPTGRPLYQSLGFVEEAELERWQGVARDVMNSTAIIEGETAGLEAFDREAFGADRSRLLRRLVAEGCCAPVVARTTGVTMGYALARQGLTASHIGPVMARDKKTAIRLLDTMLTRLRGADVCLDVAISGLLGRGTVSSRGLAPVRTLARMTRGVGGSGTVGSALCASAGPEYG